jgi:hypothetical protein
MQSVMRFASESSPEWLRSFMWCTSRFDIVPTIDIARHRDAGSAAASRRNSDQETSGNHMLTLWIQRSLLVITADSGHVSAGWPLGRVQLGICKARCWPSAVICCDPRKSTRMPVRTRDSVRIPPTRIPTELVLSRCWVALWPKGFERLTQWFFSGRGVSG